MYNDTINLLYEGGIIIMIHVSDFMYIVSAAWKKIGAHWNYKIVQFRFWVFQILRKEYLCVKYGSDRSDVKPMICLTKSLIIRLYV